MAYYFIGPTANTGGTFVNPFYGPDGSAAAPTYSFTSDPTSGIFWNNSSTLLSFSVSGTSRMTISAAGIVAASSGFTAAAAGAFKLGTRSQMTSTADGTMKFLASDGVTDSAITAGAGTFSGVITTPAGAVGAPGINFGTADTGFYAYAASKLAVTTAGTARMYFDEAGLVSIGVTPQSGYRLVVRGSTTNSSAYSFNASNSDGSRFLQFRNDGELEWRGSQFDLSGTSPNIQADGSTTFQLGSGGSFNRGKVAFPNANTGTVTWTGPSASSAQAFIWNAPASGSTMMEWQANGTTELTLSSTGVLTATGDLVAPGGFKQTVLQAFVPSIAANQTDTITHYDFAGTSTGDALYVPPFAGSIMGLSFYVKGNLPQSGKTLTVTVFKNGSATGATTTLTGDGSTNRKTVTFAKDTYTFAAGDDLELRYSTDATYTTTGGTLIAWLMVEQ